MFHAGLIALLFLPAHEKPRPLPRTLALFDISASAAMPDDVPPKVPQPDPVPPTPPQPVIVPPPVIPLPTPSESVVAMLAQADLAAMGGSCDLTAPVEAALRASEAVRISLPQIPDESRSVANAIMVWNVDWVAVHETLAPEAMAAIRDTVAGTVAAASPECRLQPQSGPRLIVLPGTHDTTVLALGSGVWRWQDMVDSAHREEAPPENLIAGLDDASIARR